MNIPGFLKEFKEFALKGNLVDLAVAFVLGAAFTQLSNSFIQDLVMPWIGMLGEGTSFVHRYVPLAGQPSNLPLEEAKALGAVFAWGNFLTISINFVLVAFVMFVVVKLLNKAKRKKEEEVAPAAPPELSGEEKLLAEIRDLLKDRR